MPSTLSTERLILKEGSPEDESVFIDENHCAIVLKGLQKLRKDAQFCDVTLLVDETYFPVHKNILASFSAYFQAMFTTALAESKQDIVTVKGIDCETMKLLLDFAYSGSLKINISNVQSLLSAANLLQFNSITEAASDFLEKHMNTSNWVGILCFAEIHSCLKLVNKTKNFALKNFVQVYQEDEFLKLSQEKLIELIQCDELEVENEETVFKAVIKWLLNEPETRKINFYKILENIRLPLMSPYFIHDCVENTTIIQNCNKSKKLVEEAKIFHLLLDRRIQLQSQRAKLRTSAQKIQGIVAVGGEDEYNPSYTSVKFYDPSTKIWYSLRGLPKKVSKNGIVASGKNTLYLAGGEYCNYTAQLVRYYSINRFVFCYDPVLNIWQEIAPMQVQRSEFGLAILDGFIYAVGGWGGSSIEKSVERYDARDNSWRTLAHMEIGVADLACVAHNGMLYVAGGMIEKKGDGVEFVQRYDPLKEEWSELSPLLIPRKGSAGCVLHGYIYVLGGWHPSTQCTNTVERYNIQNDKWEFVASMHESRYKAGVAVIDNKIFVLGGEDNDNYLNSIECYYSDTDTWIEYGEMPSAGSWFSCVSLQVKKSLLSNKDA